MMHDVEKQPEAHPAAVALDLAVEIARGGEPPPREVLRQVRAVAGRAADLAPDLVRGALEQVILGPAPQPALQWLHDAGLLEPLLPELEATVNFTQEADRRHKDVWKHTKQVVEQSVLHPAVRWAALLHDIGKVPTRVMGKGGKVTFHGHAEVGARMFSRLARRLEFPEELGQQVRFLVLHHLRANQYDGSWTDSAVRRFDREMGEHLERLLDLSRADITSARRERKETALSQIADLQRRILELREQDARIPPLPGGLGDEIMAHFQLPPGRHIGEMKRALEQAIEAGDLEPHQQPGYYLEALERLRAARLLSHLT